MTRPSGSVPKWSSDNNYPLSSNAWSNTATKIDPGAIVASGAVPRTKLPAQFFNWILNRLALFLVANDAINIQNLIPRNAINAAIQAVVPNVGRFLATDPSTGQMWLVGGNGGNGGMVRSFDGDNWIDETANIPAASLKGTSLVFSSIDGFMWYVGAGVSIISRTNAGVWAKINMPNSLKVNLVDFDPLETLPFIFAGESNASHPAIWIGNETLGSMVSPTLTNAFTYTGEVAALAVGPTRTVAFASCSAPAVEVRQWDVDSWANVWSDRGALPFGGATATALAYGAADNLFMATTDAGTVYVSVNGTVWTLQATLANTVFERACLIAYGSIWVAIATVTVNGAARWVMWSVDGGITWNQTPFPDVQTSRVGATLALGKDCVCIVTSSGAGATPKLAMSLHAK